MKRTLIAVTSCFIFTNCQTARPKHWEKVNQADVSPVPGYTQQPQQIIQSGMSQAGTSLLGLSGQVEINQVRHLAYDVTRGWLYLAASGLRDDGGIYLIKDTEPQNVTRLRNDNNCQRVQPTTAEKLFAICNHQLWVLDQTTLAWQSLSGPSNVRSEPLAITWQAQAGNRLFATFATEGVFWTTDEGKTWQHAREYFVANEKGEAFALTAPPRVDDIVVHPGQSNLVIIHSDQGYMLSSNNGESFYRLGLFETGLVTTGVRPQVWSPAKIQFDAVDPSTIYFEQAPYLLVSRNLGKTFDQIPLRNAFPDSVKNAAIATHPNVSGSIYVLSEQGVSLSRDFGQTWQPVTAHRLASGSIRDGKALTTAPSDLMLMIHPKTAWLWESGQDGFWITREQ